MSTIQLTQGKVAVVDDQDAHLAAFRWCAYRHPRAWYAQRAIRRPDGTWSTVLLHRVVLGVTDPKIMVDHRNGDGLDCRRVNLRIATTAENAHNQRRATRNTSGFKGVSWHKRRRHWQARIMRAGHRHQLGCFSTPEEAARAYDIAARELHGEFACLNFSVVLSSGTAP
jgi:hypothetical protein